VGKKIEKHFLFPMQEMGVKTPTSSKILNSEIGAHLLKLLQVATSPSPPFYLFDIVLLCSPAWSGTNYPPAQPPECWDYRCDVWPVENQYLHNGKCFLLNKNPTLLTIKKIKKLGTTQKIFKIHLSSAVPD
jgi:hypothetical protein